MEIPDSFVSICGLTVSGGKDKPEPRALTRLALHADDAPLRLDYMLSDGQTQSRTTPIARS